MSVCYSCYHILSSNQIFSTVFFEEMEVDEDDILVTALCEYEERSLGFYDIKFDTFHLHFKNSAQSCHIYAPVMSVFNQMGFRTFILELLFKEKQELSSSGQLLFLKHVAKLMYALLSDCREDLDVTCDEFLAVSKLHVATAESGQRPDAIEYLIAFLGKFLEQVTVLTSSCYTVKFKTLFTTTTATKFLCKEKHYTEQREGSVILELAVGPGMSFHDLLKNHYSLRTTDGEKELFCSVCKIPTTGHRQRLIMVAPSTFIIVLNRNSKQQDVS